MPQEWCVFDFTSDFCSFDVLFCLKYSHPKTLYNKHELKIRVKDWSEVCTVAFLCTR